MQKYLLLFFSLLILSFSSKAQDQSAYRQKFSEGNYLILETNYALALKTFLEAYQIDSSSSNVNYKVGFCYLNSSTEKGKALPYLEKAVLNTKTNYIDMEPREKAAPVNAYYYYGQALHFNYNFDEAIANFEKFKSFLRSKQTDLIKDVNHQIEICNNAKYFVAAPISVIIKNLGDSINSEFPDYSPVISGTEKTLLFTSRRPGSTGGDRTDDNQFFEDIYISHKKSDSTWTTPVSVSSNINTSFNEASIGLTADEQTLLIYKDANGGDIYFSTLDGNDWSYPQLMGSDINTPDWETSACLTPDGKTLYFVSNRKEGSMGGRDIWKCIKLPTGQWSKAQNLGLPINTEYDEESPYINPSGNVLFFSSKGHKTIGGFDIFFSTKSDKGWDEPLNIGYPINTTDDDVFFVTSPDGKRGYYSSSSRPEGYGEKDIYEVSIPKKKEQPLVLIKGQIIPQEGQSMPDDIEIVATDIESGIVTGVYKPLLRDGSFTIIIPPNSHYTLSYQKGGEEFFSELMDVPADAEYQEIEKSIHLKPVDFGVPVDVQKDTTIVTYAVEGKLFSEKNTALTNLSVNLINSKGDIIQTTTTDKLGWFIFAKLPQNDDYLIALDESDTHLIGKKSSAEIKDDKGNVIKTGSGTVKIKTKKIVIYYSVNGKIFDEKNAPYTNQSINLLNSNGEAIKTTATDTMGWFIFSELPQNDNYIVALDGNDTRFIGKKSSAEIKDSKGNIIKSGSMTVKFKNYNPVVINNNLTTTPPEQLARVDKQNFQMNFKYNVKEIDVTGAPFIEFIGNLVELYQKNGNINITIMSSASQVPTRAYKTNKELSIARSETSKDQLLKALKEKGVDTSKVKFVKVSSVVGGPIYNTDYFINKAVYEKFQFIKIGAY